jgi:hypothetical protein
VVDTAVVWQYLDLEELFADVDGASLLRMMGDDFEAKGVKRYHTHKLVNVVDNLRLLQGLPTSREDKDTGRSNTSSGSSCSSGRSSRSNSRSTAADGSTHTSTSTSTSTNTSTTPAPSVQTETDEGADQTVAAVVKKVKVTISEASVDATSGGSGGGGGGGGGGGSGSGTGNARGSGRRRSTRRANRRSLLLPSVGAFRKGGLIGQGAFGRVYIALSESSGGMLAVKEVGLDGLRREEVERLRREIKLMSGSQACIVGICTEPNSDTMLLWCNSLKKHTPAHMFHSQRYNTGILCGTWAPACCCHL